MEKRFILAIVLSFIVLILWTQVFSPKQPATTPRTQPPTDLTKRPVEPPSEEKAAPQKEKPAGPTAETETRQIQPVAGEKEEDIVIDTSLFRAVWSNKGGVLKSWQLKEHKDENGEDLELVSRSAFDIKTYPFFLSTEDESYDRLVNDALYETSTSSLPTGPASTKELRFKYADEKGNQVEKTFTFRDGFYDFDVDIRAIKEKQPIDPRVVWGPGFSNMDGSRQGGRFGATSGVAVYPQPKVERRPEKKYDPQKGNAFSYVQWAAYESNYFAAIFVMDFQKSSAAFLREEAGEQSLFYLSMNHVQRAFLGPKNFQILDDWGYNTKKIVNFGLFGWISEILYKMIKAINRVVPNWGLCIILLTLLIKIILFPLTYSSTKSMSKMQQIQPKVKALRAKYKKAKQDIAQRRKMNEEMMALYKEHGVNPAGGCLPMLLQIPVFWGIWRMLVASVEFRHAPFILWLGDLTVRDPYYVTPILMGITQYISQKMTPTSGDPSQQKMMLIMPVLMTFLFMSFPSGLILYWLTNNVLQIGQQYITNRLTQKKKSEQHGKRRKK